MKLNLNIGSVLGRHRMLLGFLLGVACWLVFDLMSGTIGIYTMAISLLIAMWVSHTFEPKRLAILGILLGLPEGILYGVRYSVTALAPTTAVDVLFSLMLALVAVPLAGLAFAAVYALYGLLFGAIAQLYNRKAIF